MKQPNLNLDQAERLGQLVLLDNAVTERINHMAPGTQRFEAYIETQRLINNEVSDIITEAFK